MFDRQLIWLGKVLKKLNFKFTTQNCHLFQLKECLKVVLEHAHGTQPHISQQTNRLKIDNRNRNTNVSNRTIGWTLKRTKCYSAIRNGKFPKTFCCTFIVCYFLFSLVYVTFLPDARLYGGLLTSFFHCIIIWLASVMRVMHCMKSTLSAACYAEQSVMRPGLCLRAYAVQFIVAHTVINSMGCDHCVAERGWRRNHSEHYAHDVSRLNGCSGAFGMVKRCWDLIAIVWSGTPDSFVRIRVEGWYECWD